MCYIDAATLGHPLGKRIEIRGTRGRPWYYVIGTVPGYVPFRLAKQGADGPNPGAWYWSNMASAPLGGHKFRTWAAAERAMGEAPRVVRI